MRCHDHNLSSISKPRLVASRVICCVLLFSATIAHAKDSLLALPPAPRVITSGQLDAFAVTPEAQRNNRANVFYATPRLLSEDKTSYGKTFDDQLRLGSAKLSIGPQDLDWAKLHTVATSAERKQNFDIHLNQVEQIAKLAPDDSLAELSADMQAYVDQIDATLKISEFKDITIIAHGAFNSFYYAVAEAAQYRFYTGKQAVVIAYAWPAVENHLAYKANAKHAEQSEAGLVRLVKVLGKHSSAERINIIGYSVGGRLAGGAMAQLADEYQGQDLAQLNQNMRLGHLYLTSSDEPIKEFLDYAPAFAQMFDLITVTIAYDDPILGEAQLTGGGKRLGRPVDPNSKAAEKAKYTATEAQQQGIHDAVNNDQLHILNLEISDIPGYQFYHGSWYLNPWVSSDVFVSMHMGLHPSQRGLASLENNELTYWYFPPDYIAQLRQALLLHQARREQQEVKDGVQ